MLARHLILPIQPARDNPLRTSPWLRLWGAAIGWEDPMSCPMVGWAPVNLFKVLFVFTLTFPTITDGLRSFVLILFYAVLFVLNAKNMFTQSVFPRLLSFIILKFMAKKNNNLSFKVNIKEFLLTWFSELTFIYFEQKTRIKQVHEMVLFCSFVFSEQN